MKPFQAVEQHRAVLLLEDVAPDLDDSVRTHTDEQLVERGVMQFAQRKPVGHARRSGLAVRHDVRGVEQLVVTEAALGNSSSIPRYEPLQIRPSTTRDRSRVIALWERVFPDDPPHNAPAKVFDAKLAMHDDMLFVATDVDSVIGTAMAGYDGHRGWLYTVAVSPEHRRRGIGTALVRHAVEALRMAGCTKVNLQIRATNTAVRGFYESLGFGVEERLSMGMHIR